MFVEFEIAIYWVSATFMVMCCCSWCMHMYAQLGRDISQCNS